jgi:nucleoside-diphosphate-sugar epimerase
MTMKVLIVGNMGYVGPVLSRYLRAARPDATIHGFDNAYFAHCLTGVKVLPERSLDEQFYGDVRTISKDMLRGYDAVIQLAAISNDPMGNQFEAVTMDVNQNSALTVAGYAAEVGVKHFVFASSCSVYGIAQGGPRKESDALNPITAYAKSKIGTEQGLQALDTEMVVTCLRFATACGMSDRLRLDLVLNDYVACALTTGEITVLSDGTPWRPLIDVADMARAMDWAIDRKPENGGRYLSVNAGSNSSNYQVKDLAEAVAAAVPGTRISINYAAPVDSRSYQADFTLYEKLAPTHQPLVDLNQSVQNLIAGLKRMDFKDQDFRKSNLIRLVVLQDHISSERLSRDLEWQHVETSKAAQ